MGLVIEELIRKFAKISNETAGEHFTPREVIKLMVNLHAKLAEWETFHNYHRPHGGLGGKSPYERLIEKMR